MKLAQLLAQLVGRMSPNCLNDAIDVTAADLDAMEGWLAAVRAEVEAEEVTLEDIEL